MNCMTNQIPTYNFAISDRVGKLCPYQTVDGKEINVRDFLPTRARTKDTGYDVRCGEPDGVVFEPFSYFKMRLGIRMFCPEGWWTELKSRSGVFINENIISLYGTIDETYENELMFAGVYIPDSRVLMPSNKSRVIEFGQRVAQLIPVQRQTMQVWEISNEAYDHLCKARNDERKEGGFGSSGKV